VPSIFEAPTGIHRPGDHVWRGWPDLLVTPGAPVGLRRRRPADPAHDPLLASPLDQLLWAAERARPDRRVTGWPPTVV